MLAKVRAKWQEERPDTRFPKQLAAPLALFFILWVFVWHHFYPTTVLAPTPFVDKYVAASIGNNGRWYIPPSWLENYRDMQPYPNISDYLDLRNPREPAEAAQLALELAIRRRKFIGNSKIPLIVHQTWKDCNSDQWPRKLRESADSWLAAAVGSGQPSDDIPEMAYILWDDEAIMRFFALYEPQLWVPVNMLPNPVEKTDIFRVAVLKWFGGIYADIDTTPIEHPAFWVHHEDLAPWVDPDTAQKFALHEPVIAPYQPPENSPVRPHPFPDSIADLTPSSYKKFMTAHAPEGVDVAAIVGLEADTSPESDDYWRAGYTFPVQLTNWAFAFAPQHPMCTAFLNQAAMDIQLKASTIYKEDPLEITGPPAFTKAVKAYTEQVEKDFRWEGVTGLRDAPGGRGKVVAGDILVLPITGFSPGRGKLNNMGSRPLDDPNARLYHAAAGNWRKFSLKVETGKLCRTTLGMCRNWSKVP